MRSKLTARIKKTGKLLLIILSIATFAATQLFIIPASALEPLQADIDAEYNWPLWNPSAGACGSSIPALTGSDQQEKVWNFLKSNGLTDAQAAGIMGNIMQESHFDPIIAGDPTHTWETKDPSTVTASDAGWGIVQWTPGAKVITIANALNISPPSPSMTIDQFLSTELQIMWEEIQGKDPSEQKEILSGLKQITGNDDAAAAQAAKYFDSNFEGGSDPGGVREAFAVAFLGKYGGSNSGNGGSSSSSSSSSTGNGCSLTSAGSVSCTSGTGTGKILGCAKRYDPASYSESGEGNHLPGGNPEWIRQVCPAAGQPNGVITPSCYLDCSGLVNIAVYDAFGYNLEENTEGEIAADNQHDSQHPLWQVISFNQLQPGDLIQPGQYAGDHVEIVERVQNDTIYTFGAHTSNTAQPYQVGDLLSAGVPVTYTRSPGDVYLHWVGPMGNGTQSE